MIVKTRVNEQGVQLYAECVVGKNGVKNYSEETVLSNITPHKSERTEKRHLVVENHTNNRKSTRGRIVQHTSGGVVNHISEYRLNTMKMMAANKFNI